MRDTTAARKTEANVVVAPLPCPPTVQGGASSMNTWSTFLKKNFNVFDFYFVLNVGESVSSYHVDYAVRALYVWAEDLAGHLRY